MYRYQKEFGLLDLQSIAEFANKSHNVRIYPEAQPLPSAQQL